MTVVDVRRLRRVAFDDDDSRSRRHWSGLAAAGPGDRVVPGSAAGVRDGVGVGEQPPREIAVAEMLSSDRLDGVQLERKQGGKWTKDVILQQWSAAIRERAPKKPFDGRLLAGTVGIGVAGLRRLSG